MRQLDVDTAVDFLLSRGLLSVEELVAGRVAADSVTNCRNLNLRVSIAAGSGFFIKQPDELSHDSIRTLRVEGDFYHNQALAIDLIAVSLPKLLLYEPDVPLLVLELLPAHRNLQEHYGSFSSPHFPVRLWRELGRRLGHIHLGLRTLRPTLDESSSPWVARAHEPSQDTLATLSSAGLDVLKFIQSSSAICEGLDGVNRLWEPSTVIHGDIRAGNVLVQSREGARDDDIRLVDWEMSHPGDPLWDVAGLVAVLALFYPPLPRAVFQSASRALCEAYTTVCDSRPFDAQKFGPKVASFCSAVIVQSVIEMSAEAAGIPRPALPLLKLCKDIFEDPWKASTDLFAIG